MGHLNFDISHGNSIYALEPIGLEMRKSNPARYCLENLSQSRGDLDKRKTLGVDCVKKELIKVFWRDGKQGLSALIEEAKFLSHILGLEKEYQRMDVLLDSLLSIYHTEDALQSHIGVVKARQFESHNLSDDLRMLTRFYSY